MGFSVDEFKRNNRWQNKRDKRDNDTWTKEETSQDCVATSFRNRIKLCIDVRLLARKNIEGTVWFFSKIAAQVYLGVSSFNLWFVRSYLIKYAHNDLIIDFSIFGICSVIFSCD